MVSAFPLVGVRGAPRCPRVTACEVTHRLPLHRAAGTAGSVPALRPSVCSTSEAQPPGVCPRLQPVHCVSGTPWRLSGQ